MLQNLRIQIWLDTFQVTQIIPWLQANYNEQIYITYSSMYWKYIQVAQMIPLFLAEDEEN